MLGSGLFKRSAALHELADEELMALIATGDERALEVVFDRHSAAAFALAYRMAGQRSLAEDIVQEAFLSVWRSADQFDEARGSVRSFVLRVVRNRAIDSYRRRVTREGQNVSDEGLAERLASDELTEATAVSNDEAHRVRDALQGLPEEQRRVIELAYFGGLSHQEIADRLGLPTGTVKGRMRLGLTKLRQTFAEPVGSVL